MKRIRVIVGSSIEVWDKAVTEEMNKYKRDDVSIEVVHLKWGPESIENTKEEQEAAKPMLEGVIEAERDGCDAAIIYCFGDPGLERAKHSVGIPVVGIGEASYYLASYVGTKFGVITAGPDDDCGTVPLLTEKIESHGLQSRSVGVMSVGIPVLGLGGEQDELKQAVKIGGELVKKGADVLLLGCGSLLGLEKELEKQLGAKIIMPAIAGLKLCEIMLEMNITNSAMVR